MPAAFGPTIDYLVAGITPLAKAVDPNVDVADNVPNFSTESTIVIGREGPQDGTAGQVSTNYGGLGALRMTEIGTINGYVWVEQPGPDQKPARDLALRLLDVVIRFVHSDPTLGGILADGRIAVQSGSTVVQTEDPGATGAQVFAMVGFTLSYENSYLF